MLNANETQSNNIQSAFWQKKKLRFFWRLVIYMEAMQACNMDSDLGVFRWRGGQFWIQPKNQRTVDEILPFVPSIESSLKMRVSEKKSAPGAGNGHNLVRGKYAVVKAWIRAVGEIFGLVQTSSQSSHSDFPANVQKKCDFFGWIGSSAWLIPKKKSTIISKNWPLTSQWLIAGPAKKSTSLWVARGKNELCQKIVVGLPFVSHFLGQSLTIQDGGDIGCYPPTIMVQRWSQWACFGRIKHLVLEEPFFFTLKHDWFVHVNFMIFWLQKALWRCSHWKITTSNVSSRWKQHLWKEKKIKANPPFKAQILLKITICCQRLHFLYEKTTDSQRVFTTGTDFLDMCLFENLPMTRWKACAIGCCHWVNPKNSGLTWPSQWLNSWEGRLGGTELGFCNIKPAQLPSHDRQPLA